MAFHLRERFLLVLLSIAIVCGLPQEESKSQEDDSVAKAKQAQNGVKVKRMTDVYMCSDLILNNDQSGTIYSPGYPGNYIDNLDCSINVIMPGGVSEQTLRVTATSFNTENNFDYLYFYYGDSGASERFTGDATDPTNTNAMPLGETLYYSTTSGSLRVRFVSDAATTAPGFAITFDVYSGSPPPPPTAAPPSGTGTPQPSTVPPTGRCADPSGSYISADGSINFLIQEDKYPNDTENVVYGFFRNNSESGSLWLQSVGFYEPQATHQLLSFTGFLLGTEVWTFSGLCEECSAGKHLEMYENRVLTTGDCALAPTAKETIFVKLDTSTKAHRIRDEDIVNKGHGRIPRRLTRRLHYRK